MSRKRFHGLKKVKIRATWNKYNLFNITRLKQQNTNSATFYQQKWTAKSTTRAYHGEQVREKQWERMFSPRMNAVIPMDHRYLAENDGSELAAGRGSGLEQQGKQRRRANPVPYMHMTYAPLERRLDMAIFRSLFASSARQARQMVTHGQVKVNGHKMPYPGYLLNPGDMFQVEPERVLFATGAPKSGAQAREGRYLRRVSSRVNAARDERRAAMKAKRAASKSEGKSSTGPKQPTAFMPRSELEERKERRTQFQILLQKARGWLEKPVNDQGVKVTAGAKKKQEVRGYIKDLKSAMSRSNKQDLKDLEKTFISLSARFTQATGVGGANVSRQKIHEAVKSGENDFTPEEQQAFVKAVARIRENPVDDSKPYATPWRPRPYMSAFAFIPRYLEVNHFICSAVYLRHPVARPGLAEVPSPFPADTQQLAFNWYLRRR